uniref:Retrovirus-related Pol polyprotein from transposon TNT 1-94 n=1 Tax=Cajanus cajan TaxID=3821 RepID=A0A151T714_CAJCA|nr:Retrovirus-related Pol polyprotein from transposon TNT 1-94 [Cajanus cajan]
MPYRLTFVSNKCFIQDMNHKKMIGTVEMEGGLYKFNKLLFDSSTPNKVVLSQTTIDSIFSNNPKFSFNCNKQPIDLWHYRLGHPSVDRLHMLKQSYPSITVDKQFVCETCHLAKQKKISFPHSDSHSLTTFALVHVDIWGPCAITSMHGHRYFLTIVDDHTRFVWVFLMRFKAET